MIRIRELSKRFRDRAIFTDLDLDVGEGERVVILGPSGTGKTTLLRCLVGLERFEQGKVQAFDVTYSGGAGESASLAVLRSRLGFVFQRCHLFAHMTARENVASGPRYVDGATEPEAYAIADRLLARLGLSERSNARPRSLSGGEEQRVAIARALARSPKALLLDEPTSALDPDKRGELAELLVELSREDGVAMIVVTHDMDFARNVATRIVTLDGGRLRDLDSPNADAGAGHSPTSL